MMGVEFNYLSSFLLGAVIGLILGIAYGESRGKKDFFKNPSAHFRIRRK